MSAALLAIGVALRDVGRAAWRLLPRQHPTENDVIILGRAVHEVMSARDAAFSDGYVYGMRCAANIILSRAAGFTLDEAAAALRDLAEQERALVKGERP